MSDGMEEIIEDFVTEAEESLEKIDPLFVELEEKGYDREMLNDIFRSMHTIKGAAGFLGFQGIVDVSHKAESLLKKLRDDEINISRDLVSIVLKSSDVIKLQLSHIKQKDGVEEDITHVLSELDEVLAMSEAAASADRQAEPAPAPQAESAPQAEPAPTPQVEETPQAEPAQAQAVAARQDMVDDMLATGAQPSPEGSAVADAPEQYDEIVPPEVSPDAPAVPPEILAAIEAAKRATGKLESVSGVSPTAPVDAVEAQAATGAQQVAQPQVAQPQAGQPQAGQPQAGQAQAGQRVRQSAAAAKGGLQTLRVDVDRIDKVMNLTGEIVLVRNRLLNIASALEQKHPADEHVDGLQEAVSFLDLVTSDIQLAVMKMRMQPIKKVFGKFPRLVRDIAQNLGKDVQLSISGEDTEVDRSVIERIGDPLVHALRNAIDHGIESVEDRRAIGKSPKGFVEVKAYQQGSQIVIEVTDDGRGLNVEKIKKKAVRNGLVSEEESRKITDKEAINLIFLPGFTTVEVATELSGRGVGMDVVKTNISRLNGYVEVLTTKNMGTTIKISIPLTLAIIQALMVRTGGVQYAIPLGPIEETLKVSAGEIKYVSGQQVLSIRDHVYPVAELTDMLRQHVDEEEKIDDYRYVLVIAVGDRHFCVSVDELLGQEEVVIKAIEGIDTDATGILGATITGEGKIVLILDPSGMSRIISGLATV